MYSVQKLKYVNVVKHSCAIHNLFELYLANLMGICYTQLGKCFERVFYAQTKAINKAVLLNE